MRDPPMEDEKTIKINKTRRVRFEDFKGSGGLDNEA